MEEKNTNQQAQSENNEQSKKRFKFKKAFSYDSIKESSRWKSSDNCEN